MKHFLFLPALLALTACPSSPVTSVDAPVVASTSRASALQPAVTEPTPEPEPAPLGEPGSVLARESIPHHDPRFHDHYEEALIVAEQGDLAGSIDRLRMALFDAPDSAATWYELGRKYLEAGRRQQAVECIGEAASREPRHEDAQRFLARHFLDRGEPELAQPHVRALARHARDDFRTPYLQSRLYVATSMWDEAIAASRRAIALQPEFIYAYNNLGFAALQRGRNDLAVQYLEAATELTPLEPYMLNNLGIAYERLDRPEDALAAFQEASALDPGYVKAVANRDRVQVLVDERLADSVADFLQRRAQGEVESPEDVASAEPLPESLDLLIE